nr:immunoglobulin heavy chain junction region [Mus musculus]
CVRSLYDGYSPIFAYW